MVPVNVAEVVPLYTKLLNAIAGIICPPKEVPSNTTWVDPVPGVKVPVNDQVPAMVKLPAEPYVKEPAPLNTPVLEVMVMLFVPALTVSVPLLIVKLPPILRAAERVIVPEDPLKIKLL